MFLSGFASFIAAILFAVHPVHTEAVSSFVLVSYVIRISTINDPGITTPSILLQ